MRIGLSFSRCVRDIVDGKVKFDDVLVVISRTDFDPHVDEQWRGLWIGYGGHTPGQKVSGLRGFSRPEWAGYANENDFRATSILLWEQGKLHQPRQFGAYPSRLPYYWLEATLPSEELEKNPAVKAAWERFVSAAFLSGIEMNEGQG